jgi:hypothetical protein
MPPRLILGLSILLTLAVTATSAPPKPAAASPPRAGRVQLELVGDAQGAAMTFQEWVQALGKAGIKVQMSSAQNLTKPNIEVRGSDQFPLYVVTGIVVSRDELLLPSGRFRRSEMARLAEWLDDLAQNGPLEKREKKSAFGLTAKQLEQAQQDLGKPVGFTTRGLGRAEAIEKIGENLGLPLAGAGNLAAAAGDDKIEEELSDLSRGAALACILRPMGYSMVPRQIGGKVTYSVSKAKPGQEVWPIGWPPEKPLPEVLPEMFEFRSINVQNAYADKLLAGVTTQLKVPILLDHNALARHNIDPAKAAVSFPQARTTWATALRRLLSQAGLRYEIRVDEAGKPFLWVSTMKPV